MFTEANLLIAPNVGHFAVILDDEQRVPTKDELEEIINFLTNAKHDLYPDGK